ncbi:hypothetical protein EX30DRAFT_372987 [Ascodesmis nigricans]|uniref:Sorting nexin MVP1 n=1 Tax=Ascodesmis nigricans TaxID=341454 RepID=A0A4S2MQB9_9PEZI|nr:hypothetical protein EX30DRAFT_372987 [Ascodesmis nigricans]
MSLFGDSPPPSTRGLFSPSFSGRESALFDDDASDGSAHNTWGSGPQTPPASTTRTSSFVLSHDSASIPAEYDVIFSNLPQEPALRVASLLFDDADLSPAIRNSLFGSALLQNKAQLTREDVYSLLAICALAQRGEDYHNLTEHRHNLPVPAMRTLAAERAPSPPQQQAVIAPKPVRSQTSEFMNAEDPWSGQQSPAPVHDEPDDIHAALRATRSDTWADGLNGMGNGFGAPPPLGGRIGSYGGLGGNSPTAASPNGSNIPPGVPLGPTAIERIKAHMTGPEETVTITILPEKEGMFMFQHRNYTVASSRRNSRVVRRYSDFVWLLDCLHKRYPFRTLPLLPPKRIAVNGHYLSADSTFLIRRQRGLTRFTNSLVQHPILSQDHLVIMFLTVPTELSVWRKQASISITDEFHSLPPTLLPTSSPPDTDLFDTVRSGLRRSADHYITLVTLFSRLHQRSLGLALDMEKVATTARSLTDTSLATYALDTSDIPALDSGLLAIAHAHDAVKTLLTDEAHATTSGVLEDLKRHRDALIALRELFDRIDRFRSSATSSIASLTKRITANEKKLTAAGSAMKDDDAAKLREAVKRDRESVEEWRRKEVWSREVVRQELWVAQYGQYRVGRLWAEYAGERVKYAEMVAEGWRGLQREVEGMAVE